MFLDEILPEPITREFLEKVLAAELRGASAEKLVAMMYSPCEAIVDFSKLCAGEHSVGSKISLLFNPHRLDTRTKKSVSIVEALSDRGCVDYVNGIARLFVYYLNRIPARSHLYHAFEMGCQGIQFVNEFPPTRARDIYCRFGARRILDPCAGWGGRMIGAASIGAYYHGFEPATCTYEGLMRLGEWLRRFDTGFKFKLENIPFEDAELVEKYDIALTSPPYFDTEFYSDEPTQARIRYPSFERFVRGFVEPLIHKSLAAASKGLVLNLGSRLYDFDRVLSEFKDVSIERLPWVDFSKSGLGKDPTKGERFWHLTRRRKRSVRAR